MPQCAGSSGALFLCSILVGVNVCFKVGEYPLARLVRAPVKVGAAPEPMGKYLNLAVFLAVLLTQFSNLLFREQANVGLQDFASGQLDTVGQM